MNALIQERNLIFANLQAVIKALVIVVHWLDTGNILMSDRTRDYGFKTSHVIDEFIHRRDLMFAMQTAVLKGWYM